MNSDKGQQTEGNEEDELEMKDLQPEKDAMGGAQKKEDPITDAARFGKKPSAN